MRTKPLHRMTALLLCVFLCLGAAFSMMGAAYAADVEPSASGVTIEIMLPTDWASTSAAAKVCVTDETGGGFASVEVRIDRNGSWRNITASLEQRDSRYYGTVDMTANCTVYVRITGHDGQNDHHNYNPINFYICGLCKYASLWFDQCNHCPGRGAGRADKLNFCAVNKSALYSPPEFVYNKRIV